MKTLLKITMGIVLFATVVSCKENEKTTVGTYNTSQDSITTIVDTVGPNSDTTNVIGAGTTGATGEGSTGSGSAGTLQKGNTNMQTDSTTSATKKSN